MHVSELQYVAVCCTVLHQVCLTSRTHPRVFVYLCEFPSLSLPLPLSLSLSLSLYMCVSPPLPAHLCLDVFDGSVLQCVAMQCVAMLCSHMSLQCVSTCWCRFLFMCVCVCV